MKCKNDIIHIKKNIYHHDLNKHNYIWYTFKKGELVPENLVELFLSQGGVLEENSEKPIEKVIEKKEEVNLDLNNDGKIDEKDASIAGKVLVNSRKKSKKSKKK